ncbi:MAG: 50S ribosomal protein L6 [Minisyncoccia bacterium]
MSRIGKKAIIIPEGVKTKLDNNLLVIQGPKGEGVVNIPNVVQVKIADNQISVLLLKETKDTKALWGTTRALINNVVIGVTHGFQKDLEIEGVGYRVSVEGNQVVMKVGFINLIKLDIPKGIEVKVDKNLISVMGISKEQVGQFAAIIKSVKPVEPYKGKGIHYKGERIRRKAGKKLATAAK